MDQMKWRNDSKVAPKLFEPVRDNTYKLTYTYGTLESALV